jgi:hypothetical protein
MHLEQRMPRIFTVTTVLIVFTLIIASTPPKPNQPLQQSAQPPNLASITKALQMKLDQAQRLINFQALRSDLHSSVVKLPRVFRNTSQAL